MKQVLSTLGQALQNPAVQAQVAAAGIALAASYGFHLPATDVGALVAVSAALLATWLHLPGNRSK